MFPYETRDLVGLVHQGTRLLAKGVKDDELAILTNAVLSVAVIHLRYPIVSISLAQHQLVQELKECLNKHGQ
jgi:hypothetical protein